LIKEIYQEIVRHNNELNKTETLQFFNDFLDKYSENVEEKEIQTELLLPG